MTPYEALVGNMNAEVDNHLGDSVSAFLRGMDPAVDDPVALVGFLEEFTDPGQIDGAAPIRRKWALSLTRQANLPDGPASILRLTNVPRLLGIWYRPAAGTIERDGDGWRFDLQRAV